MIIAFASGKGGTGKTTVSANLAWTLSRRIQVQYSDCDVEEPNGHLFLRPEIEGSADVSIPVPEVDQDLCSHCGACSSVCQFHAIASAPTYTLTFPELCHGCGACVRVCTSGAIREVPRKVGVVETGHAGAVRFVQGRMNTGEAMSPPIIRAVKAHVDPRVITIVDAPPGTSCPSTTALGRADLVVLVAEPTRFGQHDLSLAVEAVRSLQIPFGVVINRADWGDSSVEAYCSRESIPIWGRLPHDRSLAEAYAVGLLASEVSPQWAAQFLELGKRILQEVGL